MELEKDIYTLILRLNMTVTSPDMDFLCLRKWKTIDRNTLFRSRYLTRHVLFVLQNPQWFYHKKDDTFFF